MLFFDHQLEDSVESRQFNQNSNFLGIDISKEILKCMYKCKGTKMAQTILKELSWKAYSTLKTHYKAMLT